MIIHALKKSEKTAKVLLTEDKENFNVGLTFWCYRCGLYNCVHVIEVIERLSLRVDNK